MQDSLQEDYRLEIKEVIFVKVEICFWEVNERIIEDWILGQVRKGGDF